MKFLGHVVSSESVRANPVKTPAVAELPLASTRNVTDEDEQTIK